MTTGKINNVKLDITLSLDEDYLDDEYKHYDEDYCPPLEVIVRDAINAIGDNHRFGVSLMAKNIIVEEYDLEQ
tara:strand:+ start:18875 stop:19093 length:219 start_codon:yes stop_codon:yes gene_type:complete